MGLLDFITGKGKAAPTATGAITPVAAEDLKREIAKQGVDASKIDIKIDGDRVTLSGSAPTAADVDKIVRAVDTAKGVARVENNIVAVNANAESKFYTVQRGDTLWKIAESHYGHGKGGRYKEIFEANKELLRDPDKIYPGQRLRIP
ncbi:peptidoglycan-binding protein LysM (plasmid) [Methylocystis sp. MJC1]|uniref:peptidoglycan-binding protein LysM n=1 Tax=Methylocystis sp. MJC1 TaxID=2654282 RepID=UPI001C1E62BD|nr:peptidoglycan-binding protein LysM [Methylocystis sp. MJC1]MBU6529214.1 peptidoglycan-binding protein LysM [Methylocystis sp. MJC1]UZX13894.1 peptidoglycan-binding protein LysM [Methylocystis sp. MJC1]